MNTQKSITVVGISGSLRTNSHTLKTVQIALNGALDAGAHTQLIDLNDFHLPLCNGNTPESNYPENVFKLREIVLRADGIILGTPEYHGGVSGVLKNALDLLGIKEFENKMVGLVGVAGGAQGAIHSLDSLRISCRSLRAWVTPQQASIAFTGNAFDESGKLKDSNLEQRVLDVGKQVT